MLGFLGRIVADFKKKIINYSQMLGFFRYETK